MTKISVKKKKKITFPGERIVRSYSIQRNLFDATGEFADLVKTKTGLHCDRSKLITMFAKSLKEVEDQVDLEGVESLEELRMKIAQALCKINKK